MANQDPKRVVTGKVRFSYAYLFNAKAGKNGGNPKYSVTILVPKSDAATKQRIDAAIQAAINEGVSSKWNGTRPPQPALPVHDGDGARPSDGMPFGPECKGHWVFTASTDATKRKPEIVDAYGNPIIDQSEIYSGIYGRVSVTFAAYNNEGKKGIGCYLNNVQKLEDGEPLAGNYRSAQSDFGGGFDSAPVQQPYQAPAPQPYQVPPQQQYYNAGVMAQPVQPAPMPTYQAPQQAYPAGGFVQPAAAPPQQQIDPITGRPVVGTVMGI